MAFSAPGRVPRERLPELYHALDLYVSPSRDEGGPAGALEAMASGVPVVSSRTGIPADIIEHGRNGMLSEADDVDGFTSAVVQLMANPARRSAMARAALATIQPYDWPVVAERYATELYGPLTKLRLKRPSQKLLKKGGESALEDV